ncbi:MAG: fatty acid desaturase [Pseudomonadota bacterium]
MLRNLEWPTVGLITVCYALWLILVTLGDGLPVLLIIPLLALTLTLHSSLTHEVVHGHPTPYRLINHAFVFLPITLVIPLRRFEAVHLAHHQDHNLTDPYDDPESFYTDPVRWAQFPVWFKRLLKFNNTLFGRMLVGPTLSFGRYWWEDMRSIVAGDRAVRRAWSHHVIGLAMVGAFLWVFGTVPVWVYLVAAYLAVSILMIRTFLEHQAHELSRGRSVIIEDRGPLSLLFLNNNLHAVHHAYPRRAWYELPEVFRQRRSHFLKLNLGYVFPSYLNVIQRFAFRAKEPVPHPFYPDPDRHQTEE